MTAQILDRMQHSVRIGDPKGAYPIIDTTGSVMFPGRWNTSSSPMLYTSEHFSTALLEKLVHGSGRLPPNQHYVALTIPPGLSYEYFDEAAHPGWDAANPAISQDYGEWWQKSRRSLLLFVPSVVARPDRNILINPHHPDFGKIETSLHKPIFWDKRLFL